MPVGLRPPWVKISHAAFSPGFDTCLASMATTMHWLPNFSAASLTNARLFTAAVSINTAAVNRRAFVKEAAEKFGNQCIVVAIDAKQVSKPGENAAWEIFTHGGRNPTGIDAVGYAKEVVALGAGEILLTSMDRDGTRKGFDIALTRAVADAVPVPVIASGGVGTLEHMVEGIRDGHATAVLAASIFHFGEHSVRQAKLYMAKAGLSVRLDP